MSDAISQAYSEHLSFKDKAYQKYGHLFNEDIGQELDRFNKLISELEIEENKIQTKLHDLRHDFDQLMTIQVDILNRKRKHG